MKEENQVSSQESLNSVFIICTQKTVISYPATKREQNSTKQFFKTGRCIYLAPLSKYYVSSYTAHSFSQEFCNRKGP